MRKKKKRKTKGKTVSIGATEYRIRYAPPNDPALDGPLSLGSILYEDQVITIDKTLSKSTKAFVLFHELYHGAACALGLKPSEHQIRAMTHLLYNALKQVDFRAI